MAINVDRCFGLYKSGIYTENENCTCGDTIPSLTHAVTIVGWSNTASAGCSGYYIVKNSWSAKWGENGFIRMCIPVNSTLLYGTCNINYAVMIPQIGLF